MDGAIFRVLKLKLPVVEKGAHIAVHQSFAGRSYMARALKSFYGNDVELVEDPNTFDPKEVPSFYVLENNIGRGGGIVVVKVK